MDPNLKNALVAIGLVDINASDAQAQAAWQQYQQQNPAGAQQIMQQLGGAAGQIPWLTVLGVMGGLVALYFVWNHYKGGRRQVDAYEYPEEDDDDSPRLHAMSESLGVFKSLGAPPKKSTGCRGPRRMGKYEFEPERRLEGYRRKKR